MSDPYAFGQATSFMPGPAQYGQPTSYQQAPVADSSYVVEDAAAFSQATGWEGSAGYYAVNPVSDAQSRSNGGRILPLREAMQDRLPPLDMAAARRAQQAEVDQGKRWRERQAAAHGGKKPKKKK
ncbi:hypothetical protein ACFC09_05800 [Streptomyces sp. NPDC056161]|uniref:hypothetical protein n=1 Tax=Streptomyces sp. NPDC056161 TaxID=3345732 RepID=UPI0035D77BE8